MLRGCLVDQFCIFCVFFPETCDHLFRDCILVRYIRICDEGSDASELDAGDVRRLWTDASNIPNAATRSKSLTRLAAIWWVIWTERNNTIFRKVLSNAIRALERVASLTNVWNGALWPLLVPSSMLSPHFFIFVIDPAFLVYFV
ncbi:uncharacterized protein LOC109713434 [Ananas comosus]|uniref:Uncharacterized protein LOC109713434 n=1 Tax=Ananas comosus TaxID=4615 RepID=A0A6P5FAZ0_ANACO|nr:uncharacterized protein LOC109713434 [Ananas comosus]